MTTNSDTPATEADTEQKIFKVTATLYSFQQAEIAAGSLEEAEKIAIELDGAEFTEFGGEWEIHLGDMHEVPPNGGRR